MSDEWWFKRRKFVDRIIIVSSLVEIVFLSPILVDLLLLVITVGSMVANPA